MLRYLPFLLVMALLVYSSAWLFTGRTRRGPASGSTPAEWHRDAAADWVAPDDNPEFLKSLDERARGGDDDPRQD
ncbi:MULTISPECIES: hypothetical protein [unclassified Streptomyces]|uniref:hypothetical protein n=1 Tax=unclassified Streptomyces TaxID=2593676 RepID=UPI00068F11D0|nr:MULTISPECIES: hypothetical protein [unclassified Streptomyces]